FFDHMALCNLLCQRLVHSLQAGRMSGFAAEDRKHADEKPGQNKTVLDDLENMGRHVRRIEDAGAKHENQVAHHAQDQRKYQPVIKIVGLPRSLVQVSKRSQAPYERWQQSERPVKKKVWIVRTWESYERKNKDAGRNADSNKRVDNAL